VNDIEQRIKQLLNESVDAQLGPQRPAPPFEPRRIKRLRRFGHWAAPLVAAASVAALVGGAIGVAHVASSGRHPQPGRSVSPPTPTPTTAPTGPDGTSAPTESPRSSASNQPTSQPSATSVTVPRNLNAWILSRPHPQLPTPCPSGFVLYKAPLSAHLTGSTVPDTVARVDCRDATSGANAEIDVYGAIHGEYALIYRVPLPANRPGLQFSSGDPSGQPPSVSGNVLTVTIAGYVETTGQHDPMCCPTTVWQQKYTFDGTTVSQGPLTQVSPPTASGRWTDSHLVITANSLGAVTRGMTLAQATAASGTSLSMIGDSIYRPTDHTIGGSTTLQFSWGVTCFDATRSTSGPGTTVTTSAGVRLGDPMSQIAAAYGSMAKPFTAAPTWTGAGNIPAGIIVQQGDGVLLFVGSSPDHRGGTITSIRAAADAFHASSVFC
jgi:hypothetical protein